MLEPKNEWFWGQQDGSKKLEALKKPLKLTRAFVFFRTTLFHSLICFPVPLRRPPPVAGAEEADEKRGWDGRYDSGEVSLSGNPI